MKDVKQPAIKDKTTSVLAFRKLYDKSLIIPDRIKAALVALGASDVGWESEASFVKRCGLSTTDFGRYRELFEDHFLEVRAMGKSPTRVWVGTKELMEDLRKTLI